MKTRRFSFQRRGVAFALVLAVLLVWTLLRRDRVVEEDLALDFGASANRVREVDLHFQRSGERDGPIVRDLSLVFPSGAPTEAHHAIKLKEGSYEVGVRVLYRDGLELHVGRPYQTGQSEAIALDRPG